MGRQTAAADVDTDAVAGRRRDRMVVVLTVVSGSIDALGFIALGGAFTSVMTGNMVLTGVAVARTDWTLLYSAGAAIVSFVLGCAVGARLAGPSQPGDGVWPSATTRVLQLEWAALAVFSIGWWSTGAHPGPDVRLPLLMVNAVALGLQSSAVQRFGVPGLSTTYLTGTLTTAVVRLATGRPVREIGHSMALLVALVCGGAAGALLTLHLPALAPALPLLALAAAVLVGRATHTDRDAGVGATTAGEVRIAQADALTDSTRRARPASRRATGTRNGEHET